MARPSAPVLVGGKVTKQTQRDVTIRTTDIRGKQRDVVLPMVHLLGVTAGDYWALVPQWWAYQQKLPYQAPTVNVTLPEFTAEEKAARIIKFNLTLEGAAQ